MGHANYEYYSIKHDTMLEDKEWKLYRFPEEEENWVTSSELLAKKIVKLLRNQKNYARIICGYETNRDRIKMYSVIYKLRKP